MAAWLVHEVRHKPQTELARCLNRDLTTMSAAAKHFENAAKGKKGWLKLSSR